jgi:hypothetical protein
MPVGERHIMDITTWISVAALALVVPLGVATNLLTPKVVGYLERRKLLKTHRTREQEISEYKRIEEFKNRVRDRYPYYILLSSASSIFMLIAFALALLTFWHVMHGLDFSNSVLFAGFAVISFMLSIVLLITIAATARRIERFDDYTAQIRAKWGNDAV